MSALYLGRHAHRKIIPEKILNFYKQIRLAEVLRDSDEYPRPPRNIPADISVRSVELRNLTKAVWESRNSRSRAELIRDTETIKNKIREVLSEYGGLREEIRCHKEVMTRATELFNLQVSKKNSEECRSAQKRFNAAKLNSKRQKALGRNVADQLRTYIRFTDLLLLAYYPENLDKALALYEESLISQKTIWGKMSEVYKSSHMRESSYSAEHIPVYNAILEAEARRERNAK